jgi:hypothetical protein
LFHRFGMSFLNREECELISGKFSTATHEDMTDVNGSHSFSECHGDLSESECLYYEILWVSACVLIWQLNMSHDLINLFF